MRKVALIVCAASVCALSALALPAIAGATIVNVQRSSTWRQTWTTWGFSGSPNIDHGTYTDTPYFITRYIQLPSTIQAGDLLMVSGREQFTNPTWNANGFYYYPTSTNRTEHWSTPIMGSCAIVTIGTYSSDPNAWTTLTPQDSENWNGVTHHWIWNDSALISLTAAQASDYIGLRCYFSRSDSYIDPSADQVVADSTLGELDTAVVR